MSTVVEEKLEVAELTRAHRRVVARLDRLRRQLRLHLTIEGLFWVALSVFVAAVLSLLLDRWLRFERPTRIALLAIALAAIGYVAYRRLIQPLRLRLDYLDVAELLDRRTPGVGQQISNVLQLPELLADADSASPSMVRATVLECVQALDRRDLAGTLNVARRRKLLAALGVGIGIVVGFCYFSPDVADLWARRWLAGSTIRWPQQTYLSVLGLSQDGTLLVPRGEMALVNIDSQPSFAEDFAGRWRLEGRGEPLVVESPAAPQSTPPEQVSLDYTLANGTQRRGNATQFDEQSFRYELPPLAEPAEMHITGGDDWLGPITIEPIDRPGIETLEISATPPGSKAADTVQRGRRPPRNCCTCRKHSSNSRSWPTSRSSPPKSWIRACRWPIGGAWTTRTYTLEWTMSEPLALEVRLSGLRGGLVSKPYFLAIGVLKDREPRVTIRASGVGRRVTPVARIPLFVRANDDFGLGSLALDWELTVLREDKPEVETQQLPLAEDLAPNAEAGEQPLTQFEYDNELALRETGLTPGNVLKLRGTATDACTLGAQTGNSRWVVFQIVASDELFYEILMRQREQRAAVCRRPGKHQATVQDLDRAVGPGRRVRVAPRSTSHQPAGLAGDQSAGRHAGGNDAQ